MTWVDENLHRRYKTVLFDFLNNKKMLLLTFGSCCQGIPLEMGLSMCQGLVLTQESYFGSAGSSDAAVSSLAEPFEHLQFLAVRSGSQHAVLKIAPQNQTFFQECLLLLLRCPPLFQHRSPS